MIEKIELYQRLLLNNITSSYDLLIFLKEKNLLQNSSSHWWEGYGTFEVLITAILTQNTKWQNVEKSIENIKKYDLLNMKKLSNIDLSILSELISSSGFKNQKSKRIKNICQNIIKDFENFENFTLNVSRSWLLNQKGIGNETCDSILCYACKKDHFVIDTYTNRLLKKIGFEFDNYDDIKEWFEYGINENFSKIEKSYGFDITINQIYCRFHGKIIEFMKNSKNIEFMELK